MHDKSWKLNLRESIIGTGFGYYHVVILLLLVLQLSALLDTIIHRMHIILKFQPPQLTTINKASIKNHNYWMLYQRIMTF